jgi:hypothetical protein
MAKPITNPNDAQLQSAYAAALAQYGEQSDVCGVDIGYRYAGTRMMPNDGLVVRVHRSSKLSASDESARAERRMTARASSAAAVPPTMEGVPLVFLHAKYARHQGGSRGATAQDVHKRVVLVDPLCPGVQVAQRNGTGGTLGLIVFDLELEEFSILSNEHVLRVAGGHEIDQPELAKGGTQVATFTRAIAHPTGDAALARLNKNRTLSAVQFGTKVVVAAAANVLIGDVVQKSGAASGLTTGVVDGIGRYRMADNEKLGMDGFRIVAKPRNRDVSKGGDSGAVWFRKSDHKGLGLHVGGDITVANLERRPAIAAHLPAVLQALRAEIRPIS